MIPFLEASLVRPLGLVVAAWLVLRIFRVQHPASRHAVWAAVLVGMLALPIISVVSPRLTLPILPAPQQATSQIVAPQVPPDAPMIAVTPAELPIATDQQSADDVSVSFAWPSAETMIVGVYIAGFSLLAMYRLLGWALLRRVLFRSRATRPACLRESADVVTPIAVGVLRPSVILPAGWRTWDVRTRRVVLAHEFAHLRRRDTMIAALARLTTSVFWFHPAAWWVARKTSDLAELACDAVALERVGDPAGYSRVLVEFAYAVHRSGHRVALPGLAMASGSRINDRVDQVFEISKGTMRRLARPRMLLAVVGLPVMCLVGTLAVGARAAQQPAAPPVKFDVVSIKPCREEAPTPAGARGLSPFSVKLSPGYAYWDCVTVSTLILQAYTGDEYALINNVTFGRERDQDVVKNAPDWTRSEKFSIEARGPLMPKYPNGYQGDLPSELRQMIRAMLEDRFQLKMRHVTEERPLYALSVAVGGPHIGPAAPTKCWKYSKTQTVAPPGYEGLRACGYSINYEWSGGDKVFQFSGASLDNVAVHLTSLMNRNVVNRTGLEGRFDFSIKLAADENTPGVLEADAKEAERAKNMRAVGAFAEQLRAQGIDPDAPPKPRPAPSAPNIFKAFELVGLKLDAIKGPQEFFVVDSIERPKPNEAVFAEQPTRPPVPQTVSTPTPKFDVVSIKPCPGLNVVRPPGSGRSANPGAPQITPGYVHWDCVTLAGLIDQAWAGGGNGPSGNKLLNVLDRPRPDTPKRVRGGPSWVHDELFTIEAKVSGDVTQLTGAARFVQVRDAMLPALRAMIEDRFQLKLRKATEQQPMYAMTVAKGGLKITQTAPQNCWRAPIGLGRGEVATPPPGFEGTPACGINVHGTMDRGVSVLEIQHANLQDFAKYLSTMTDRYVLDKTGVQGRFSFKLEYLPDDNTPGGREVDRDPGFMTINGVRVPEPPPPPPRTDGVSIFKALEALGLKLEPTRGPAEYLQIESVQRPKPNAP